MKVQDYIIMKCFQRHLGSIIQYLLTQIKNTDYNSNTNSLILCCQLLGVGGGRKRRGLPDPYPPSFFPQRQRSSLSLSPPPPGTVIIFCYNFFIWQIILPLSPSITTFEFGRQKTQTCTEKFKAQEYTITMPQKCSSSTKREVFLWFLSTSLTFREIQIASPG